MTTEYKALNYTQRIIQGDSFDKTYAMNTLNTDTNTYTPIDLSNKIVTGQLRLAPGDTPAIDFGTSKSDGGTGIENSFTLTLTSTQTTSMRPGTWYYDVQLTDSTDSEKVDTVLKGNFIVRAEITQ